MTPLLIQGMHGLGDNLHQRAVLRQVMERHDVWLESSWVAPYHDLIAQGLKVVHKTTSLRTQTKNSRREAACFARARPPRTAGRLAISYRPEQVRRVGSVLGAMCETAGVDAARADFRLPVPEAWRARARQVVKTARPILLYRPLVERREWGGCPTRNPDHAAYAHLARALSDRFFVVSVADLVPGQEWMVGEPLRRDLAFHCGELPFETLAGLVSISAMVLSSPGFAVVLAQAVGTPVACVFGGYESSRSFSAGARFAPYLGIDPVTPCECFSHGHGCDKRIDLPFAEAHLAAFAAAAAAGRRDVA